MKDFVVKSQLRKSDNPEWNRSNPIEFDIYDGEESFNRCFTIEEAELVIKKLSRTVEAAKENMNDKNNEFTEYLGDAVYAISYPGGSVELRVNDHRNVDGAIHLEPSVLHRLNQFVDRMEKKRNKDAK